MKLGEAMYAASQAGAAPGADGGGEDAQPKNEDVVDAEFSEVDEENKG
jgi:molecular chaperone DnaK